MILTLVAALQQVPLPAPRGFVNDFAGVLDARSIATMDSVIRDVRARTRGDIAVVTVRDLGGRPAAEFAVRIGREWGVGGQGAVGDPARNLGVVILLKPREGGRPGTGDLFIATGRGAEGFLPDARVGRIRDAMLPALAREEYGAALRTGVDAIADAFLVAAGVRPPPARPSPRGGPRPTTLLSLLVLLAVGTMVLLLLRAAMQSGVAPRRRRRRWWVGPGWGGGGFGGFGGFGSGGGGFGGFGGGGGFSGGGAGGKF